MGRIKKTIRFLLAKENRIGAVILLIGVVAFVFMSVQAANRFIVSSNGSDSRIAYDNEVDVQAENFRNVSKDVIKRIEKKKVTKSSLKYPRQENIEESAIQGAWTLNTDKYRYLLQLTRGQYKLVLIPEPGTSGGRYYSVGTYSLEKDLLQLKPINYYEQAATEFPGYRVFTRSSFPFFVRRDGSNLILQKPTREAGIYVPPRHPLLREIPEKVAVFSPLK